MSTPVSVDTPPRPAMRKPEEEDNLLHARLQEMLDLQYEQQEREMEELQLMEGKGRQLFIAKQQPQTQTPAYCQPSAFSHRDEFVESSSSSTLMIDAAALAGVGQGTLLFPKGYRESVAYAATSMSSTSTSVNTSLRRTDVSLFAMHQQMLRDSVAVENAGQVPLMANSTTCPTQQYGSIQQQQRLYKESAASGSRLPGGTHISQGNFHPYYDSSSGPQILFQHSAYSHYHHQQQPHHGSPTSSPSHLCTTPFQQANPYDNHNTTASNCFRRIQSCWTRFQRQQEQQQPACQRSFCYGAIDGLLTGSGIVAALVGMQILLPEQPPNLASFWSTRWSIVVLCWAACGSDAICMALSHLWNGHITLQSQGHSRRQMNRFFLFDRNRAKAQLMDWLVQQQGLLKIDAMSLADTLEGYPDLFSSVLLGEPLISPVFQQTQRQQQQMNYQQDREHQEYQHPPSPPPQQQQQPRHEYPADPRFPSRLYTNSPHEDDRYHPYGIDSDREEDIYGDCSNHGGCCLCCSCCCCAEEDEVEMGPSVYPSNSSSDNHTSNPSFLLWQESQWESWCMMWGFWLASGIPSLLFLILPYLVLPTTPLSNATIVSGETATTATETSDPSNLSSSSSYLSGGATSVASVVVTMTALIMWCLGVWKSRFHPTSVMGGGGGSSSHSLFSDGKTSASAASSASSLNWMIFGMETVIIFLVCIISSYGCGWLLSKLFVSSTIDFCHHLHHHRQHANMTLVRHFR